LFDSVNAFSRELESIGNPFYVSNLFTGRLSLLILVLIWRMNVEANGEPDSARKQGESYADGWQFELSPKRRGFLGKLDSVNGGGCRSWCLRITPDVGGNVRNLTNNPELVLTPRAPRGFADMFRRTLERFPTFWTFCRHVL